MFSSILLLLIHLILLVVFLLLLLLVFLQRRSFSSVKNSSSTDIVHIVTNVSLRMGRTSSGRITRRIVYTKQRSAWCSLRKVVVLMEIAVIFYTKRRMLWVTSSSRRWDQILVIFLLSWKNSRDSWNYFLDIFQLFLSNVLSF